MLFNSIEFAFFIPVVFFLYWMLTQKNLMLQNILILLASYFFYGWWDWRFLSLIIFSSCLDYVIGHKIYNTDNKKKKKVYLWCSLIVNLGFLAFFKYFNFFIDSFEDAFSLFGTQLEASRLNIILPVGISFYTFQTLSYTIDIYRGKLKPTKDPIAFFAFVSFFPQLVAGPIERATNLLPQFLSQRKFEYAKAADGMRQILWGLFKKIVIADNCAVYVNEIFANHTDYSGSTLFLGAVLFAFQIYGDFSGYSDIAIGTARLFGFNLMKNFAFPYFSRDIAEFWRRWHISLSTWFRDYLYIPLGGSRAGKLKSIRNVFIIFLVSGFWHGANWTFIIWGFIHAVFFIPIFLAKKNRRNMDTVAMHSFFPTIDEFLKMVFTFFIVVLAWVFFRADNITQAGNYLLGIFDSSFFSLPQILSPKPEMLYTIVCIAFMCMTEWFFRNKEHGLEIAKLSKLSRWSMYVFVGVLIISFGNFAKNEFIYFQF